MDDRISIIVPTYNRREMLQRLLESFCRLQCHCPLEFIIVDDCSDDGTGGMVEEWRKTINSAEVKYHRLASRSGPARARNAGIILATGNIIAFTDSDCIVDPRWAEQLYQRLISCPEYAGAGGRVLPLSDDIYSTYNTIFRILEPQQHLKFLVGANCIFWKQPVIDVGMFDDYFNQPGGEETALCMKLGIRGYRFGFETKAIVYHDYRKTLNAFIRSFLNYGTGEKIMIENRLTDYLQYIGYPERIDDAVTSKNNGKFLFLFSLRILLYTIRQIPAIRDEPLSPVKKIQLLLLCFIQNICYHIGRGTFSGTLVKTVNLFIRNNPGCLVKLNPEEIPHHYLLEITDETVPKILKPGQRVSATMTIKNLSKDHWISMEYLTVMLDTESPLPFFRSEKTRNLLISPGSASVYRFRLYSPKQEKDHRIHFFIASSSGMPASNKIEKKIFVTSDPHYLDAELIDSTYPEEMISGESIAVSIRMRNTGKFEWSEKERIRLGSKNDAWGTGALLGDLRMTLPPEEHIPPGSDARFTFRITAPRNPGKYLVQYRMVLGDNFWFGNVIEQRIDVKANEISQKTAFEKRSVRAR
jgi:glycosyltransferase involved in cell wall biosynthesis